MTTRTKYNIAMLSLCVMLMLSSFSHPLGIPDGVQLVFSIGILVLVWPPFIYAKRLKEERAKAAAGAVLPAQEASSLEKRTKKRLFRLWLLVVAMSLAAPLWLPITGTSLGFRGNCWVGVASAVTMSVVFWISARAALKREREKSMPSA